MLIGQNWRGILMMGLVLAGVTAPVMAQRTRPERGWSPTGTFSLSEFDSISQTTGALGLRVPLTSLPPGRGGSPGFQLELIYNNALYDVKPTWVETGFPVTSYTRMDLGVSRHGGWNYNFGYGIETEQRQVSTCGGAETWKIFKTYLRTPDGNLHVLAPYGLTDFNGDGYYEVSASKTRSLCAPASPNPVPAGDMVYATTDGSFIRVEISWAAGAPTPTNCTAEPGEAWQCRQWRIFLPDGTEVRGIGKSLESTFNLGQANQTGAGTIVDRNGNETRVYQILTDSGSVSTIIEDPFGRTLEIEAIMAAGGQTKSRDMIRRFGYGATAYSMEVTWSRVGVSSMAYTCGPSDKRPAACYLDAEPMVVEKVSYPQALVNNNNYTLDFTYAAVSPAGVADGTRGWGELRSVRMPPRFTTSGQQISRASVEYKYKWDNYPVGDPGFGVTRRDSTGLSASGGLENPVTERILRYQSGEGQNYEEKTIYTFTHNSSTITGPDSLPTTVSFYDLRNAWSWDRGLVYEVNEPYGKKTQKTWSRNNPFQSSTGNPYVKSEVITLPNSTKTIRKDFSQDKNGNVVEIKEYNFNSATVLRSTRNRYLYPVAVAGDEAGSAVPDGGENANAYWRQQSARRNLRAMDSQATRNGGGDLGAYRELSYDAEWNVTQTRQWDSTLAMSISLPGAGMYALTAANSVVTAADFTEVTAGTSTKGNPKEVRDANSVRTTMEYGAITGCMGANPSISNLYPTGRVMAAGTSVARSFSMTYDCNTGVVTGETDGNRGSTTTIVSDLVGRPLIRTESGGGVMRRTRYEYLDAAYVQRVSRDREQLDDGNLTTVTHLDDLGRPYLIRTTGDAGAIPTAYESSAGIRTRQLYHPPTAADPFRYELVSNPIGTDGASFVNLPDETLSRGWTRKKIDALGRVVEVAMYSGEGLVPPWQAGDVSARLTGRTLTAYAGDETTVTDPAGVTRRTRIDALGRIAEVVEAPGVLNLSTTYDYDILDNLREVKQGNQTRTYEYTSLSRLKTSKNVEETAAMGYTYDRNGNLKTKTDARGVTTVIEYDELNRPKKKSYTGGIVTTPEVTYGYL